MSFKKHIENAAEYGFVPHDFFVNRGGQIRECNRCGCCETLWDDDEYPINPCEMED